MDLLFKNKIITNEYSFVIKNSLIQDFCFKVYNKNIINIHDYLKSCKKTTGTLEGDKVYYLIRLYFELDINNEITKNYEKILLKTINELFNDKNKLYLFEIIIKILVYLYNKVKNYNIKSNFIYSTYFGKILYTISNLNRTNLCGYNLIYYYKIRVPKLQNNIINSIIIK